MFGAIPTKPVFPIPMAPVKWKNFLMQDKFVLHWEFFICFWAKILHAINTVHVVRLMYA